MAQRLESVARVRLRLGGGAALRLHGAVEELDRHREDDGGVLLGRDGVEGLQVAQLQRQRRLADDVRRLLERPRRLLLALRRDHLTTTAVHQYDAAEA